MWSCTRNALSTAMKVSSGGRAISAGGRGLTRTSRNQPAPAAAMAARSPIAPKRPPSSAELSALIRRSKKA
jgi:hypothetical protein